MGLPPSRYRSALRYWIGCTLTRSLKSISKDWQDESGKKEFRRLSLAKRKARAHWSFVILQRTRARKQSRAAIRKRTRRPLVRADRLQRFLARREFQRVFWARCMLAVLRPGQRGIDRALPSTLGLLRECILLPREAKHFTPPMPI